MALIERRATILFTAALAGLPALMIASQLIAG